MATQFNNDAQKWQARYSIARDNQQGMFRRFAKWYRLMYASVSTKDYAPWRSKVFIPILANKGWAMMAKLQNLQPGFEVGLYGEYQYDEGSQQKADKAQWKLEYDWNNPHFDDPMKDKLFSPLADALVTGTGIAKVPWVTKENKTYQRPTSEDGSVDLTLEKVTKTQAGYNDLIPVNIFNFFIAPGAQNLYNANWCIIKEFKPYDDLVSAGVYDKGALAKLKNMSTPSDEFAQEKKSRNWLTTSQDPLLSDETLNHIEVFECYDKTNNYICTYALGGGGKDAQWVEIRRQQNVYWHGKFPLVSFYVKKRPFDFWGQGIFEDTERMQNAVNDIFNHFTDSYNLSVNGMIQRREGEQYRYVVQPGGELVYRNEPAQQFKFADPNPAVYQTIANAMNASIEEATISQYATGTPNSQTDKTAGTASGILSLQQAAGDKIAFLKSNYQTTLRQIGQMWLSNNQQFMNKSVTVQGQKNNRPAPVKVNPADIQGPMVLRINDASMEPENKEQRITHFMAYLQQLEQMQQASLAQAQATRWATQPLYFDYNALVQDYSEVMGHANYDKILLGGQEVQQAIQNAQTPMVMPNERINITPADLLPSEIAQLLQRNGIQPDPSRAQGAQSPNEQVALGDAAASLAKAHQAVAPQPQAPDTSGQVTPDHLLAADQQAHQQELDRAHLALEASKQQGDQMHQAVNLAHQVMKPEPPQVVTQGASNGR